MAVAMSDDETTVHTFNSMSVVSCTSLLSKSQRLLLGLLVLLFVDVIWVLSSELTKVFIIFKIMMILRIINVYFILL